MTKRKSEQSISEPSQVEALEAPQAEKEPEGKEAKFIRLANRRVPAALKRLTYIRQLANRGSYAYSREQADSIIGVLDAAVNDVMRAFEGQKAPENGWKL